MYFRNNNPYTYSPFNVARSTYNETFFTPRKKPTLRNYISLTEKGIDTISSFIPLVSKTIPLIKNGKDFLSNINTKFLKKTSPSNIKKEKVEVEVMPLKEENISQTTQKNYKKEETTPNSPFF